MTYESPTPALEGGASHQQLTENRCRQDILAQFLEELRMLCKEIVNQRTRHWESFDAMSSHIALDYHGRCAIELMQNANDAAGPKGSLRLLLRSEDGLNVLYAANTGQPFKASNFDAICTLGLSNKDPAKNIGNKGLGFRSVLEVTTSPAIYSVIAPNSTQPGYCFQFSVTTRDLICGVLEHFRAHGQNHVAGLSQRFGSPVELLGEDDMRPTRLQEALIANAPLIERIREKLYPYMFPLLADDPPAVVQQLWREGFVTVVRLPLDRSEAFETARRSMRELDAHHLLFLKNLSVLEVLDEVTPDSYHRRFRRPTESEPGQGLRQLEEVSPATGKVLQRSSFHCYSFTVAHEALRESQASLGSRWKPISEAEITLAVKVGEHPSKEAGLFSIGLPTEKPTGSGVWIDGPFFGEISRKQIDFSKPFNSLLLREAATALPRLLETIQATSTIERSLAALKAIDFGEPKSELAAHVFPVMDTSTPPSELYETIARMPLIRSLLHGENGHVSGVCLRSLREALKTSSGQRLHFLTSARLGAHFAFANDWYGSDEELLGRVATLFGGGRPPSLAELTNVCEALVADLVATTSDHAEVADCLRGLYEDLGELFPHDFQREKFLNRKILLDQEGAIRATGSKNPYVFEPRPETKEIEGLSAIQDDVPRLLKRKIVFLHKNAVERLPPAKGTSRSARFLRGMAPSFVQTFETRDLVNNLVQVSKKGMLSASDGKEVLQWAMKLRQSTERPGAGEDVWWNRLRVPVRVCDSGDIVWKQARHVYFSKGWDGDTGELLEQALGKNNRKGEPRFFLVSPVEFLDLVGAPPTQEIGDAPITRWEWFLRHTLHVLRAPRVIISSSDQAKTRRDAFRCWGKSKQLLARQGLSNIADLPQSAWEYFLDHLQSMTEQEISGLIQGEKEFEVERFVGLDGFTEIDTAKSIAYTRLVCRSFDRYEPYLTSSIVRLDSHASSRIPSTLNALFKTSSWLPVERRDCDRGLARPADLLLVDPADLSRNPTIPMPCDLLPHVPAQLATEPNMNTFSDRIGLAHYDTLAQDGYLTWLGWLSQHTTEPVSPLLRHLWNDLVRRAAQNAQNEDADDALLAGDSGWKQILADIPGDGSRSRLGLWSPVAEISDSAGPLYLPDDQVLANQVTGKIPIAAVGKCTPEIVHFLQKQFGEESIRKISTLTLVPKASDLDFESIDPSRLVPLREISPWLVRSLLAVLAYGRQEPMNVDGALFRSYIASLTQLRICEVEGLAVEIAEAPSVTLKGEAFAWPEKKMIVVDNKHRGDFRPLFDSIGDYLNVRDLSPAAFYRLNEIAAGGLDASPSSDRVLFALSRFLATNELSRLDLRLSAEQFFVVSRLLPAIVAIAPASEINEECAVKRFQQAFTFGTYQAVTAAWMEQYGAHPIPEKLDELMLAAVSDISIEELAKRAFDVWKVDIPFWNEKAAQYYVEAGGVANIFADQLVAKVQDRLLPFALSLLRHRLVESDSREHYRTIRQRIEGDLAVPDAARHTWEPSDRLLAMPLAYALSGSLPGAGLPDWVEPIIPPAGEPCEAVTVRFQSLGLNVRENEQECFEINWPLVKSFINQLQLAGLARWEATRGYGKVPETLFTKEPRQFVSHDALPQLDSLLDFEFNDESAAFEWTRRWWNASGLGGSMGDLPQAASLKDVISAWSIDDSALEAARKRQAELRSTEDRNKRKVHILSTEYVLPVDGSYIGLRKLIDDHLDPTFGAGLDPTKLHALATPSGSSGGSNGGSRKGGNEKISEQDELAGATGEYMVLCAIKKMTGNRKGQSAWKSCNRTKFIDDGDAGLDDLGYDFRFRWNGQIYEIEVKSSRSKAPQRIRLEPSEVRRGKQCVVHKSKIEWQIWLVTDVFSAPAIHILGNPYAPEKKNDFIVDALGARVAFHLGHRR